MMKLSRSRHLAGGLPLLAAFALGGCASLPPDAGHTDVAATVRDRLDKRAAWARSDTDRELLRTEVAQLLAHPLTPDDAVQIALLQNPGLQATYADLGIAAADVAQAGRLPNPRFSTTRTRSDDSFKYETSLTLPIVALLTMPVALKMERDRFEAVKLQVTDRVLRLAADVRQAWVAAVAAQESVRYLDQVNDTAEVGAELAKRMVAVGNSARLDELRERAFAADTAAQLRRAKAADVAARERLVRLLGLDRGDAFTLPDHLPAIPADTAGIADLEAFALGNRLDVAAAKRDAAVTARSLGLVKATRFVNALEIGPATLMEHGEAMKTGYEISVELPLFDWGSSRVARAEAIYMRSVQQVAATAIDARSEVREAHANYLAARDIARHYRDEVVPLAKRISDESLLRYNGMLIGVFELLADAREQVRAAHGHIEALRDFWIAESALRQALGGSLPAAVATDRAPDAPSAKPVATPPSAAPEPSAGATKPAHVHDHSKE
jgi:outer membrane protein TolC